MSSAGSPEEDDTLPAAEESLWREQVRRALKGAEFETLYSETADGIAVAPLYAAARDAPSQLLPDKAGWQLAARLDHSDFAQASAQATVDLGNGAQVLHLVFADSAGAYGFGLPPHAKGVRDCVACNVPLLCDVGSNAHTVARQLGETVDALDLDPGTRAIDFGFAPLGQDFRSAVPDLRETLADARVATASLAAQGFAGPFFSADARVVHAFGGSEAQELAYAIASSVAYLRALEGNGVDAGKARRWVSFRLSADADVLMSLAKLRALRALWAAIERDCGLDPQPLLLHVETAWRMMARGDPLTNVLRTTAACFAAAIGGADAITVLPHTQAVGLPDAAARRLARNAQLILLHESHLGRVADPAAGSGAIETLTDQLAGAAWEIFRDWERVGGLCSALEDGHVQTLVQSKAQARRAAFAEGRLVRVGAFAAQTDAPAVHVLSLLPQRSEPLPPFGFHPLRDEDTMS